MNVILPPQQQNITEIAQQNQKHKQKRKKKINKNQNQPQEIVGPDLRKLRKVQYKDLLLQNLPTSQMYQLSYMHRQIINNIICTAKLDYIITISIDGHIKFWKKVYHLIEFIKHFKAHNGLITGVNLSKDHDLMCTVSIDKTLKIFDILNCDLMIVVKLPFSPFSCDFIPQVNNDKLLVAVSEDKSGRIMIINPQNELVDKQDNDLFIYDETNKDLGSKKDLNQKQQTKIVQTLNIHHHPVKFIKMNWNFGVCVSVDQRACIQLWDPLTFDFPQNKNLDFQFKLDTDYLKLLSLNTIPLAFNLSPKGKYLSILLKDKIIRIFDFKSGKLISSICENLKTISQIQDDTQHPLHQLFEIDRVELDRRISIEKQLETSKQYLTLPNLQFDQSQQFLIYSSLIGIKYYDITKKTVVKILGKHQSQRFLKIAVFQGKSMRNPSGSSTARGERRSADPTIFSSAFKRTRFYIFSKRLPQQGLDNQLMRDVFNERPTKEDTLTINQIKPQDQTSEVILQTTMGDIHLKLNFQDCPKACQNFIKLSKAGYYDGLIFHRVIKGFMIQTGCPKGDGTGGQSIWGEPFSDQIVLPKLRHERPFILSMANAGPNTNGSQFFITVIPCPWLDGKHTIFGRVSKGMQCVVQINRVKTDKNDKPLMNVKIIKARVV